MFDLISQNNSELASQEKKVFFETASILHELLELEDSQDCTNWPYIAFISEILSNYLWCRLNGINTNHNFDGFSGSSNEFNKLVS